MNGDAEKCDAYDKIDSASNNLNLVFILIHIKLRFIGVKISQLAEKRKGTKSLSPIALLHNLIFIDTGDECKSGFFKVNLSGGVYEAMYKSRLYIETRFWVRIPAQVFRDWADNRLNP